MSDPIISFRDVRLCQQERVLFPSLNFDVQEGEFVYLLGKTGSGKTSLLRALYADLPVAAGQLRVAGFDLPGIKDRYVPLLRRKLGIVFQGFELLTDRSVLENLLFVMRATGWTDKAEMRRHALELLRQVGLFKLADKLPYQLSGGEQQRVAIARALLNSPLVLLADEPTGNLDPAVGEEILSLFQEINRRGTAVLMATHEHRFLRLHPARVLLCEDGSVKDISERQVRQRLVLGE